MLASKLNPWNEQDMGPMKAVLGDLFVKLKKDDLKAIATFHLARLLERYFQDTANWVKNTPDLGWENHYPDIRKC